LASGIRPMWVQPPCSDCPLTATACCRCGSPESMAMTATSPPDAPPVAALDAEQRIAVDHDDGPCLVLAGPGSGKTRMIVERFQRLSALGIGAGRQLVLTYTRKAADEMRTRVERAHGSFGDDG